MDDTTSEQRSLAHTKKRTTNMDIDGQTRSRAHGQTKGQCEKWMIGWTNEDGTMSAYPYFHCLPSSSSERIPRIRVYLYVRTSGRERNFVAIALCLSWLQELQPHYIARNCFSLSLSFPNVFGSQRRPLGIFTDIGLRSDPVSCGCTW